MTEADDRRIWAYYQLKWSIRQIAAETGLPEQEVSETVARIRQDPRYQHALLTSTPPDGWEMFTEPGPDDNATPSGGWPSLGDLEEEEEEPPSRYQPRHAAPRNWGPLITAGVMIATIVLVAVVLLVAF